MIFRLLSYNLSQEGQWATCVNSGHREWSISLFPEGIKNCCQIQWKSKWC